MVIAPIRNNIKSFREQRGLTQEELAGKLGIIRTYLSKLENQKFSPGPELMANICSFFGTSLGEMFYISKE